MPLPAVFVSYSHKDADFARQLVADISPRIRYVWFDEVSIRPGRYWDDEIEKGIRESDVLLSLLSPNLLDSKICKDEFDNADRLGRPVIPILVAQCANEKMWMRMARRQWIDFRTDYGAGLKKLLNGLSNLGDYTIPLQQKCLICDTETTTSDLYCPSCHLPYVPARLGDIYTLSAPYLQKYLMFYQPRTLIPNAGVDDLLAVALLQLLMRSYDTARSLLERLLVLKPDHAYAWYVLALVRLSGKRPFLLTRSDALQIQEDLNKAIFYDARQSHIFSLLALLKSDYFERKGFTVTTPNVSECIDRANRGIQNKKELQALISSTFSADGRVIQTIRTMAK